MKENQDSDGGGGGEKERERVAEYTIARVHTVKQF